MGQSMDKPKPRQRAGRVAPRSLPRTARSSVCLDQQARIDTRRCGNNRTQNQRISEEKTDKGPHILTNIRGESGQQHFPIKTSRSIGSLKQQLIGDESVYSPNFKQLPQQQGEYGLRPWKQPIQSKPAERSQSQTHHQITISFSKTKNQNSNHVHEETLISKENLFKILEDQENSQCQPENQAKHNSTELSNSLKQINLIRNDAQGETSKRKEDSSIKPAKNAMQGVKLMARESNQNSINISKRQEQTIHQFNDYDCSDFQPQPNGEKKERKKLRLSKNLMEVKEKLISVALTTESGHEMLKSLSLQSISMRSQSRNGIHTEKQLKQSISLNQQDKVEFIKKEAVIGEKKLFDSSTAVQLSKKSLPTSNKKGKHEILSKILVFSGSDSHFHKIQENDRNRKKASIIDSNRSNMPTQTSSLKNSGKLDAMHDKKKAYLPTAGEEYDLLGIVSSHKLKSPKLFSSAQERPLHTQFIQDPNPKFLTSSSPLATCKPFEQRKPTITYLSTKRIPSISDQKKRHRSSQSKRFLNSKLLIF